VKDETSLMHVRTLPGLLSDALGIMIEEYESLAGDIQYAITGTDQFKGQFTAIQYADWVTPQSAEILAGFEPWHMRKFAALSRNRFGKGWGYYAGANAKQEAFYEALVADVLQHAGIEPVTKPPAGVEVSVRSGDGKRLLFVINHTEQQQTIYVPPGKTELLTGANTGETIELDRYGIAVIKL
jgi:beta-galactosidase